MEHSESLSKIAPALVKAHTEMHNAIKDSVNPHLKNEFASILSVLDATKPTYAKHGITFTQWPGFADGRVTLTTMLLHESGEWIRHDAGTPVAKNDPQAVGSAITYLRRYSLAAVAGIGQEDDDAASASGGELISMDQVAVIEDWIKETGSDRKAFLKFMGVSKMAEIPLAKYDYAVGKLKAKAKG